MFVFLFSLIVFCDTFDSSAAAATTKTLTPTETRALIGDTISGSYFNGSAYVAIDFVYSGTSSIASVSSDSACLPTVGDTVLIYTHSGSITVGTSNSYIQVDLQPEYSFFDTDEIHQYLGVSTGIPVSVQTFQSPMWRWFLSSQGDKAFYNDAETVAGSGTRANFKTVQDANMGFTFVDADYVSQSTFSGYSYRAMFYGNTAKSGHVYLAVSCPVVSDASSMASGTGNVTTSGTGGTTVNVDLTQTNSLLGTIADLISGLIDGIVAIFIPDEADLLDWLDAMHDMLREHFGSFIDAMTIIDDVFDAVHGDSASGTGAGMDNVSVTSATIGLPSDITVPFYGGVSFTLRADQWQMPLVPAGFSSVLGLFVDFQRIIYLILFVNMINDKLHHYLSPQDGT